MSLTLFFIRYLTFLDVLMWLGALAMIYWVFGLRTMLLFTIACGINPFASVVVKGAFLRLDWFFSLVASICAWAKKKSQWAAFFLAHAILSRVFPLVFLVGFLLKTFFNLVQKQKASFREHLNWLLNLLLFLLGGVFISSFTLGSFFHREWTLFGLRIREHSQIFSNMRFSISYLFGRQHGVGYFLTLLLFLVLFSFTIWKTKKPYRLLAWGVLLLFALIDTASYYYVVFSLLILLFPDSEKIKSTLSLSCYFICYLFFLWLQNNSYSKYQESRHISLVILLGGILMMLIQIKGSKKKLASSRLPKKSTAKIDWWQDIFSR